MLARVVSRAQVTGRRPAARLLAGGTGLALAAGALGVVIAASPAQAAPSPSPNYQSGTDTATFTVSGVLDRNCLVSTGGSHVYVKPGDSIKFNSSLAGIDIAGLSVGSGSLAGLDVSAVIDSGKSSQRSVRVDGGKSVTVKGLSTGRHTLQWTATGIPVASGLLGGGLITLPLSSSSLKSGAKLSWSGSIYVTNNAPQCKFAVLTPKAGVSLGPVHVGVPSVGIGVPGASLPKSIPSVPDLAPGKSGGSKSTGKTTSKSAKTNKATSTGPIATVPGLTVPQQVVPVGSGGSLPEGSSSGGGGGGYQGLGSGGYATAPDGSRIKLAAVPGGSSTQSGNSTQQIELAASDPDSGSGQLPVLLAIMAIIALALVAGTYARMFLLRKS